MAVVRVDLIVDSKSGQANIATTAAGLKDLGEQAKKSKGALESIFSGIGIGVGIGIFDKLAGTLMDVGKSAVVAAGDFEQTKIAFTTMLGSGEAAEAFLKELAAFAAKTPFEFPDLVTSSKRLMAMGFAAQDVIPTMTAVGNAVAGLGGGAEVIGRVTTALGQMNAKGKVSGEEMKQLAENGIPAWRYLAETLGTSIPDAMDRVSKGAVSAEVGIRALVGGMNKDFDGLMEKQSQTFLGRLSTLKDNLGFMMRDFGAALLPVIGEMATGVERLLPSMKALAEIAADVVVAVIDIGSEIGAMAVEAAQLFGDTLSSGGDILKSLTGGVLDFGTAVKNAGLAGDALRLVWVSLKNAGASLAITALEAHQSFAILRGDDETTERLQREIEGLKALKLEYSDTANKIVEGSDQQAQALTKAGTAHKELAKTGGATAQELKAHAKAVNEHFKELAHGLKGSFDELARLRAARESIGDAFGASADDATIEMGRMAAAFERLTATGRVSDAQLTSFIQKIQEQAKVGGDNTYAWEVYAAALEEARKRGLSVGMVIDETTEQLKRQRSATDKAASAMANSFGANFKAGIEAGLAGLPGVILAALQGGGNVGQSIGAHLGGTIAQAIAKPVTNALTGMLGQTLGSALGSIVPGLGTLLGGAVGGLVDRIFGGSRRRAEEHARQLQQEMARLQAQLELYDKAQNKAAEAVDRWGISIEQTGQKWQQQEFDKKAASLYEDFKILTKGVGVSMDVVLDKMGGAFIDLFNQARATGTAIPLELRPVFEELLRQGKLVDENGVAFDSLEAAGVHFAQSTTAAMREVVEAVRELVAALNSIRPDYYTKVHVNSDPLPGGGGGGGGGGGRGRDDEEGFARGGYIPARPGGTRITVGEGGQGEYVVPSDQMAGVIAELQALRASQAGMERRFAKAFAAELQLSGIAG